LIIIQTLFKNLRWPIGCLIFFASACQNNKGYNSYKPTLQDTLAKEAFIQSAFIKIAKAKKLVHSGDIITRTGNDFTSQSLKNLNQRDKTFSHCGIASLENDTVFVYHSLGGEWNPNQKIRRDPFEVFADPYNNNEIGIFRFSVSDTLLQNLVSVAKNYYTQGIMFDMDFDLKTDDRMYCAEYVYKSLEKASNKRLQFALSHIGKFEFIGVDDIYLHPLCKKLFHLIYK
jgi:hypothetical protein